jgi:RecA-family ATPase
MKEDANSIHLREGTDRLRERFDEGLVEARKAQARQKPPRQPPRIISPASLIGSAPQRRWIVRAWIPYEVVTGLYGDGGIGKSLLLMQLQTSTALSMKWLGLDVEPLASLGVYCEDPETELWRRQDEIDASYGVERAGLGDAHRMVRFGQDNTLITFGRSGVGELTRFHKEVVEAALDLRVRLLLFDTANDGFAGNENDRGQVRQYVQRAFGSIALAIDGAVVVSAHPSQAGLNSGEGTSGSGAWSNSFRSRLFSHFPEVEPGERRDDNARVLERRKANYATARDEIPLVWRLGCFEPAILPRPGTTPFGVIDAETTFLDLVGQFEKQVRFLSTSINAGNYAPRVFSKLAPEERRGWKAADFEKAMNALFKREKIKLAEYKTSGRHSGLTIAVTPETP